MREFHHYGMPTTEKQPGEVYVEATKVWVTDPLAHPLKIEYLRYEPDSPVTTVISPWGKEQEIFLRLCVRAP